MKPLILLGIAFVLHCVNCEDTNKDVEEGRGKAKYALLTHLTILFFTKVGLYKIFLGIALVIASMKAMVVMAWVLAAFRYVPDAWPHYKNEVGGDHHLHFFYVVATKLFVLKIVYGAIFYVLLTKGWHFVLWLIHYLKEKKIPHEHYVEYEHDHGYHENHDHHDHLDYYDHQPYGGYGHGKSGYENKSSYSRKKPQIYDADGSYSVKS